MLKTGIKIVNCLGKKMAAKYEKRFSVKKSTSGRLEKENQLRKKLEFLIHSSKSFKIVLSSLPV